MSVKLSPTGRDLSRALSLWIAVCTSCAKTKTHLSRVSLRLPPMSHALSRYST